MMVSLVIESPVNILTRRLVAGKQLRSRETIRGNQDALAMGPMATTTNLSSSEGGGREGVGVLR